MDVTLKTLICFILTLFQLNFAVPPDVCFEKFKWQDCGKPPKAVVYYYQPGSRCEIGFWRGCHPNLNMFPDQYECHKVCIINSRGTQYHSLEKTMENEICDTDRKNVEVHNADGSQGANNEEPSYSEDSPLVFNRRATSAESRYPEGSQSDELYVKPDRRATSAELHNPEDSQSDKNDVESDQRATSEESNNSEDSQSDKNDVESDQSATSDESNSPEDLRSDKNDVEPDQRATSAELSNPEGSKTEEEDAKPDRNKLKREGENSRDKLFTCEICGEVFKTARELRRHYGYYGLDYTVESD